ncbi:MAG TPA: GIY-YIG nuclease family protein, partial [Rubrobacter sp.]|nr:GIY-YIG nuclease family protein [Rubrobacter sp.]
MFDRPKPSEIPDKPGAYLFRDKHGRVIYVGKAKTLRSRVSSYFGVGLHPRTQAMVDSARTVDWIITDSEVNALMLEYSLIKEHRPRFNVKLVDDKSYPFLAITRSQEWPRAMVIRGKKRKGNEYFGPYAHTYAIRKTLDQLL